MQTVAVDSLFIYVEIIAVDLNILTIVCGP